VCPRILPQMQRLFVPGYGARAGVYRGAVPGSFDILEPPTFASTRGSIAAYRSWLAAECHSRRGPLLLAGHSFGAALAVLAALDRTLDVAGLVLVGPAGLPLSKPIPAMFWDFTRHAAAGWFPPGEARRSVRQFVSHPRFARRLGLDVRRLDLTAEFRQLRERQVPCVVVAASTDTLTTPGLCRRAARLCGGDYREVDAGGGHLWFLRAPALLSAELSG
jgi:pimeloyl-ACP methyl ester carboxylesterase